MSHREALASALDLMPGLRVKPDLAVIAAAARERLAQLPEKCECMSKHPDERNSHRFLKVACHGTGKVYPAELVERIAAEINVWAGLSFDGRKEAVAVLEALNETP